MVALLRFTVAALSACALSGSADAASRPDEQAAPVVHKQQITVLYDAFGKDNATERDWGYSALVEAGGKRILFDTGNDPVTFAKNAEAKGVNLATVDFMVVSHRHSDHMGGLSHVLSANPKVKIYAPKENFGIFGSSLPSTFYRKAEALPPDRRYFNGSPPDVMTFGTAWPGANIELIDKTTEVAPGVHLIALTSTSPGTLELKELSLAMETPEGLILVVGCSHPGIEKIVEAATAINERIHLIAGGLHLLVSNDSDIAKTVMALKDSYRVAWVAPGHCTGEPAFAAFEKAYGDRYLYAGLGSTIGLGRYPRASSRTSRRFATDVDDRQTYNYNWRQTLIRFGSRHQH